MTAERRTVAVVSVFHAPEDLADRMRDVLAQVDAVVIVDDGSNSLAGIDFQDTRILAISSPTNRGIAAALNTAIDAARGLGATHLVTLDQDSALAPGHVETLLTALDDAERRGARPAAAAPGMVGGAPVLMQGDGQPLDPIQSGQVVPVAVFDQIGGFREELFIDAVDSEFTARARRHGMTLIAVPDVAMAHELGELVPITFFGRRLVLGGKARHVLHHKPWRTYYMVRNSLWLASEYSDARPWTRTRNRKLAEMVLGCILLSSDRWAHVRAVRLARRDAKRGRLGRIDDATARRIAG